MNTNRNPFVKPITATVAAGAMLSGLLLAGAPAAAAQSNISQSSISQAAVAGSTSARFWAKAATVTTVTAGATAVAISGVDVTGKILLEEEKTRSPHKVLREMKAPSEAQVKEHGVVVHSMAEGQRVLAELVAKYDRKVTKVKKQIAKKKAKLKHLDSLTAEERKQLRREIRKLKKLLLKMKTSWEYKPLVVMARGTCYLNSGRMNNLDLQPFTDCVDGNKEFVVMGWVPELREAVIVSIKFLDGRYIVACINFGGFDVPPGTPDRSLFIVVENLLQVQATVTAAYTEKISLTVGGELTCPGGQVVRDEKTVTIEDSGFITRTGVPVQTVMEAIKFGEDQVRIRREARVGASVSVSDTLVQNIGAELYLECPNNAPVLEIVQYGEHLYPKGEMRYKVVAGDLEDGSSIPLTLSNITVTGAASLIVDADHPVHEDTEGNQKVLYFWVKAGTTPGDYTVTAKVTDSNGLSAEKSITKPVVPDEF